MRLHLITLVTLGLSLTACKAGEVTQAPSPPSASPQAGEQGPETIVLASYNVLYSLAETKQGADPSQWADPATVKLIAGLDADIVIFQETNPAWEGAIRAAVSKRLPHCIFHPPKRYLPEGLGACARFPLDDTTLTSPLGWFPAQRINVHVPGGDVEILNVHLRPSVAGPETWWKVNRETRALRKQEMDSYLAYMTRGAAAIVAGDLNDVHEADVFRSLERAGFENAFTRSGERGVTWRWAGTEPPLGAQIDHVSYKASSFDLISAKILEGGSSDHVPIVVTLRRRRTTT